MLLNQRLEAVAADYPQRPALSSDAETLTYRELLRRCRVLAVRFRELGVRRGDRLAVLTENRIEGFLAFWAALMIGAVAVVLNRRLDGRELIELLGDCEPALLVTTRRLAERLGDIAVSSCAVDDPAGLFCDLGGETEPEPWAGDATVPAVIVYTSGSSGKAKGVCLSHRNLWTVIRTVIQQTHLTASDSYLFAVPLHYVHGVMQLLAHHLAGAALHLASNFNFPGQIVRRLREEAITGFSGVPLHFVQLIERGSFLEAELPRLRWVTVTGGKCPPELLRRMLRAKPELRVYVAYGQTECAPRATLLDPGRLHRKLDAVGSAIPGVEVLILGEEGHPLPYGEVGEVVVAGDNVMVGYWRDPETTRRVVDDQGRLHTGDLGYLDREGDLFLIGRSSSMIKSGGERIFAERIEQVLCEHEAVQEAVVVGVPDLRLGERIEAHVLLTETPADQASGACCWRRIRRHALARLSLLHAPREIYLWTEFPYKANGKLDREVIRGAPGGRCWTPRASQQTNRHVQSPGGSMDSTAQTVPPNRASV